MKQIEEVLQGGTYIMGRGPLVVKEWKDGFDVYLDILNSFLVWIQLHNLPASYWGLIR